MFMILYIKKNLDIYILAYRYRSVYIYSTQLNTRMKKKNFAKIKKIQMVFVYSRYEFRDINFTTMNMMEEFELVVGWYEQKKRKRNR